MSYNDKIIAYAHRYDLFGALDNTAQTGIGFVGNAACGDMIKVYMQVSDKDIIEQVKVKAYGCGCALAATAFAAEQLQGMTIAQARAIRNQDLAQALGLPKIKYHCSVLAEEAIKNALDHLENKRQGLEQEMASTQFDDVSKQHKQPDAHVKHNTCSTKTSCCAPSNYVDSDVDNHANSDVSNIANTTCSTRNNCCALNDTSSNAHASSCTVSSTPKTMHQLEPFTLSPSAIQRLEQINEQYAGYGIVIGAQAGGCAGNSYFMDIASEPLPNSQEYVFGQVKIIVPADSLMFMLGMNIDYIHTETEAGFKFNNPTLRTCGCGESFRKS